MSLRARVALGVLALLFAGGGYVTFARPRLVPAAAWLRPASPGPLSAAHASLEGNCASCHAVGGVESARCVACHAVQPALIARQPTAFHATARDCRGCHAEHRGRELRPTQMDHRALARLALGSAGRGFSAFGDDLREQLSPRTAATPSDAELHLDCATCHRLQDRHREMFGTACASCHGTTGWAIAAYLHPSPRSTECAQCHRPPRSHTMEHFGMMSQSIARQPRARVDQCYLCHQTTAWNDIPGVGWTECH